MQSNDRSVEPAIIEADAMVAAVGDGDLVEPVSGRARRRRAREGLTERVSPRFTPADRAEVDAAAASAGMSLSRFCAEAALAAARGTPLQLSVAQDREALARLQRQLFAARTAVARFGTNVNQAVTVLHATGEVPQWMARAAEKVGWSLRQIDDVIGKVDRRLR